MNFLHFDEARRAAISVITNWLNGITNKFRILLVADLFGRLRIAHWAVSNFDATELENELGNQCGPWWTGEILSVSNLDSATASVYDSAWASAPRGEAEEQFRIIDRHRSRTAWFSGPVERIWELSRSKPPIVVFYSFKGGLGRSTLLASFAIQRARAGERVCVIDFDLDSPGAGQLLSADESGLTASWGVVDFLLEHKMQETPISDYFHRCDRVSGPGEITVFPAGKLNEEYADKLARVDLEEAPSARDSGLWKLLDRVSAELTPNWILLDARTGISEPAGQLLSGIAHLHVLLGTPTSQSWQGLSLVLDRLGKEKVLSGHPQSEVLLVHAMVPAGEVGKQAMDDFAARAEEEFDARYYAADENRPEDTDRFWTLGDKGSLDAPHSPMSIRYESELASFRDVVDVADRLCSGDYPPVSERILGRFLFEQDS